MDVTTGGLGAFAILTLIVSLWAVIDAVRRPGWAYESAGKSKALWLVLLIVGIFICNVGFFVALWFLFVVDPQVKRMQRFGGGIGPPGGPGRPLV